MSRDILEEIKRLKETIGSNLQSLEDLLQSNEKLWDIMVEEEKRIWFPSGVIRTVRDVKDRFPFSDSNDDVLITNIAYQWQWADVLRWLLFRFNLDFSASSITCKMGIVTYAHIAAGIATAFLKWYQSVTGNRIRALENSKPEFLKMLSFISAKIFPELRRHGMDTKGLNGSLKSLWEERHHIHIENPNLVDKKEYNKYTRENFRKAGETVERFLLVLTEFYHLWEEDKSFSDINNREEEDLPW